MKYTNYQNGGKPHTRLCHLTSLTVIDTELVEKLSPKSCSYLAADFTLVSLYLSTKFKIS